MCDPPLPGEPVNHDAERWVKLRGRMLRAFYDSKDLEKHIMAARDHNWIMASMLNMEKHLAMLTDEGNWWNPDVWTRCQYATVNAEDRIKVIESGWKAHVARVIKIMEKKHQKVNRKYSRVLKQVAKRIRDAKAARMKRRFTAKYPSIRYIAIAYKTADECQEGFAWITESGVGS